MSEPPRPHMYEPSWPGGHCAACGHHVSASWHYVKGAEYFALERRLMLDLEHRYLNDVAFHRAVDAMRSTLRDGTLKASDLILAVGLAVAIGEHAEARAKGVEHGPDRSDGTEGTPLAGRTPAGAD